MTTTTRIAIDGRILTVHWDDVDVLEAALLGVPMTRIVRDDNHVVYRMRVLVVGHEHPINWSVVATPDAARDVQESSVHAMGARAIAREIRHRSAA